MAKMPKISSILKQDWLIIIAGIAIVPMVYSYIAYQQIVKV
ncbi:MAG: hypothetical protein WA125_03155 [Desulfosporosinus sp.]